MYRYVIRRILVLVPTLFLASVAVFAIIALAPGDPVQMKLGTEATPQEIQQERARLGLDQPIAVRYVKWLNDVAHLDFGMSLANGRPVATLVFQAFPNTVRLALVAFVVSIIVGFSMGVYGAVRHGSPVDLGITGLSSLGLSIPSFWLGIILIVVFAVNLKWLPPSGVANSGGIWESVKYLIMPAITLATANTAVFSLFVRSSMIDVLGADYIRTARAKGLEERRIVIAHGLRNALLPIITTVGIQFGRLLGGAVVTETVFAYPGLGQLTVSSILNRDYPVVQAALMLVVVVFLFTNLIVDLSYGFLDPSVKLEGMG